MNELALFAGAGGGILGGKIIGWTTVCAVERDAYAAAVLAQRQNDGYLQPFPIWSDVQTFDGRPWRGVVDVISGGFPCQDISTAGKGEGISGKRSGLWKEFSRIIGEIMPKYVYVENSPALTSRGLGVVLSELAKMGYDAEWGVLGADDAGALHVRKRIWIVAYSNSVRQQQPTLPREKIGPWTSNSSEVIPNASIERCNKGRLSQRKGQKQSFPSICGEDVPHTSRRRLQRPREFIKPMHSKADKNREASKFKYDGFGREWQPEPRLGRVANGVANRVDRVKAIGNGQVPRVAAMAFTYLNKMV